MPTRVNDLSELPRNFLRCREERHSWYDPRRRTTKYEAVGNHVERRQLCASCGTQKIQLFTPGGRVVTHPKYVYPDGYLLVQGARRPTGIDVRKLAFRSGLAVMRRRTA